MRLANETGRKTECRTLWIRNRALVFSYETLVGCFDGCNWFRSENNWGPTTGRHMNEAIPRDATVVAWDRLEDIAYEAFNKATFIAPFKATTE